MIDLAILEMIHIRMAFLITAIICTTCFKSTYTLQMQRILDLGLEISIYLNTKETRANSKICPSFSNQSTKMICNSTSIVE